MSTHKYLELEEMNYHTIQQGCPRGRPFTTRIKIVSIFSQFYKIEMSGDTLPGEHTG